MLCRSICKSHGIRLRENMSMKKSFDNEDLNNCEDSNNNVEGGDEEKEEKDVSEDDSSLKIIMNKMNIKYKMFPEDSNEFPWDRNALENFKRKINKNHIECRMDDIFLLGFLRAGKFDQNRSLQLLKNYHFRRIEYPEYFENLLPSKLEHTLSHKCMYFLPKPDQKGRYIFILQTGNWDASISSASDCLRIMLLYFDFILNFHRTQENGIIFIMNAEGITLQKLFACNPRFFASLVTIIFRDSYQLCIQELHYVNMNAMMKAMLSIIIPFFPKEIKEKVYLHSDMTTLHKFVHKQYLPASYGGELANFDPSEANEMLKDNEEFFRMNEEYLKLYKEVSEKNLSKGIFEYEDQDYKDEEYNLILRETETKFQQLLENSKSYLSDIEKDSEFDIARLHENKYLSTTTVLSCK